MKITLLFVILYCTGMFFGCSAEPETVKQEPTVKKLETAEESPETESEDIPVVQGIVYEEHDPLSGTHRALEFEAIAVSAPIAFDYSRDAILTRISSYEELQNYWKLHGISMDGESFEAYYYDRTHGKDCTEEWTAIVQYDEAYFAENDLMIAAAFFGALVDDVWVAGVCADEETQGIVIHIEDGGGVEEMIDEWHIVVELKDGKFADYSGTPSATIRYNKIEE